MDVTVSAIIPVYNGEKYLAATIESLLGQSWRPLEIIVVDDGSSDNSLSVARTFEREGVRVYSQTNSGGSAARNRGFRESTGKFIQFLDQDDLLAPDKIEKQLACSGGLDHSVVSGHWIRFRRNLDETFGACGPHPSIAKDLSPLDWLLTAHMMPTCAWLTPRQLVERAGLWNEHLVSNPDDDGEFFMRVVAASEKVRFCPESQSYFRSENPYSAGNKRSRDALQSILSTCEVFAKTIQSLEDSARTRTIAARRFRSLMYMAYPHDPDIVQAAEREIGNLGIDSKIHPEGTVTYQHLAKIIGWRSARLVQTWWYKLRGIPSGR